MARRARHGRSQFRVQVASRRSPNGGRKSQPQHATPCRYTETKRANVRRWSDDSWAYTEAKTGVILDILEQATDWAHATGWASAG
jgi:hypothetical protein